MPLNLQRPFQRGDVLIIRPHDDKDPEAIRYAGKVVTFKHYGLTEWFVCVDMDGKNFYFRQADLILQQREMAV
jgi:hypothetical protein